MKLKILSKGLRSREIARPLKLWPSFYLVLSLNLLDNLTMNVDFHKSSGNLDCWSKAKKPSLRAKRLTSRMATPLGDPRGVPKLLSYCALKRRKVNLLRIRFITKIFQELAVKEVQEGVVSFKHTTIPALGHPVWVPYKSELIKTKANWQQIRLIVKIFQEFVARHLEGIESLRTTNRKVIMASENMLYDCINEFINDDILNDMLNNVDIEGNSCDDFLKIWEENINNNDNEVEERKEGFNEKAFPTIPVIDPPTNNTNEDSTSAIPNFSPISSMVSLPSSNYITNTNSEPITYYIQPSPSAEINNQPPVIEAVNPNQTHCFLYAVVTELPSSSTVVSELPSTSTVVSEFPLTSAVVSELPFTSTAVSLSEYPCTSTAVSELPSTSATSPQIAIEVPSEGSSSPSPSPDTASTSSYSSASEFSPKPQKKKRFYRNYAKVRDDNNRACERYRIKKKEKEEALNKELEMLKEQNKQLNERYKEVSQELFAYQNKLVQKAYGI